MKVKILNVGGIAEAVHAMRLPHKSGDQSDSFVCYSILNGVEEEYCKTCPHRRYVILSTPRSDRDVLFECRKGAPEYIIGPKDYSLSMKLIISGPDHRKHMRLMQAWLEIQAPLFWWKQFDTYRAGVEKVSESTMHTIMKYPFDHSFFETAGMEDELVLGPVIDELNNLRERLKTETDPERQKKIWRSIIILLPESYLQKRSCVCSYEALRNMYQARHNHKLDEWHVFCDEITKLPYSEFITCLGMDS